MKTPQKLLLTVAFSTLVAGAASAQIASDVGSNYTTETWVNGSNLGSGFGPWALSTTGTAGRYVGTTGQGSDSFGLWANGDGANSSALRPLNASIAAGETISFSVGHTQTIADGSTIGFSLWNSYSPGSAAITFRFTGGQTAWEMNDGGDFFGAGQDYAADTSIPFTFTYNGESSYSYTFGTGSGANYTAANTIANINAVSFFNNNQGADQNFGFNNLSVVPEPSTYALMALGAAFVLWRVRRRVTSGV